ncbi:MAG: alpha/beta hydrolase [Spirochaetales bacterium]|nr:alpha/beta hydrolase [Spirochaetales bacterium]
MYSILSIASLYIFLCIALAIFQEKFLFFPEKLPEDYSFQFTRTFEQRSFPVTGAVIHALSFKKSGSRGIIYYLHGNAGSLRRWGEVSYQFLALDYDVLMIDYRGYGKSTGKISEKTLFSDALSIYDILASEYGENRIIMYGRSIGSGIAACVSSKRKPAKLILEAPLYSLDDLVRHRLPWIPALLLRYHFRTDRYIKSITCPIHIFHGTNDTVVYYGSSVKLSKLLKENDEFFTIENGGHNNLVNFPIYRNNMRKILETEP